MARPAHLFVFTYDVSRDRARTRLAAILDGRMDRVQKSVFEARMSVEEARALAERASVELAPADSLRVYCITEGGRRVSMVFGAGALPEAHDFVLL